MSQGVLPGIPFDKLNQFPQVVLQEQKSKEAEAVLALEREAKAGAIDAYFRSYNMPLAGLGMKMVVEAEKNGLDWRLLPAIAVRESTGGIHACKKAPHNFFGWASCKVGFESPEKAIEIIALNLGGNNPRTEHYYADKTTLQILQKYNPPSIVARYAHQVIAIMDKIGSEVVVLAPNSDA